MQMFITNGLGIATDAIREVRKVKEVSSVANNKKDVTSQVTRKKAIKGVVR